MLTPGRRVMVLNAPRIAKSQNHISCIADDEEREAALREATKPDAEDQKTMTLEEYEKKKGIHV